MSDGEKNLAQRGLLFEGNQVVLSEIEVSGENGDKITISVETILLGDNTLAVPSTKESQIKFGESILRQKRQY